MARSDKEIRDVIGADDFVSDFFKSVALEVANRGGTTDHLRKVVSEKALAAKIADLIVGKEKVTTVVTKTFKAIVRNVQPTYAELRTQFDWVNDDYRGAHFTVIDACEDTGTEEAEIVEYLHLNRTASTDDVLAEMDKQGLRPATYEELLAFARDYPDEQRKHPIVALGSVVVLDGKQHVACLVRHDGGRSLGLNWIGNGWSGVCRFLAVRK